MACKGICVKYKAKEIPGISRYAITHSICATCEIVMIIGNTHCPCCGHKLKKHPRGIQKKENLRELKV